jgi:hypothetical protein
MFDPATTPQARVMPDAAALASIAESAWALRPPSSHERRDVRRGEAGILIDGLLTRVARGHGALDVALGEALAALAEGDRVLRLGFSSIRDYARERLGLGNSTAQALVRLARELRDRPLLAGAVRSGEITVRQAQTVLPVARGDEERAWVERARTSTVRQLEKAVREAGAMASSARCPAAAGPRCTLTTSCTGHWAAVTVSLTSCRSARLITSTACTAGSSTCRARPRAPSPGAFPPTRAEACPGCAFTSCFGPGRPAPISGASRLRVSSTSAARSYRRASLNAPARGG